MVLISYARSHFIARQGYGEILLTLMTLQRMNRAFRIKKN